MGEYCHNLIGVELLDKSVEEHNALLSAKAGEIGISLGTVLGAIHYINVLDREPHLACCCLNGSAQLALLQWFLLVEKWHYQVAVEQREEDDKSSTHQCCPQPECRAQIAVKQKHHTQHNAAQNQGERKTLERVEPECGASGLVEAKSLLNHEGIIITERQADDSRNHSIYTKEDEQLNEQPVATPGS